jgi:hypothetical protein
MADDPMFQRFGREFPRGAVLFREGEPGKEMFVVHQGRVAITKKVADVEKILSTLGPGEFLGEMAILNNRPRSATATCAEDSKLLVIDAKTFEAMIRSNAEIAVRLIKKLSDRLAEANEQIENLLLTDAASRVVWLLSCWRSCSTGSPRPGATAAAGWHGRRRSDSVNTDDWGDMTTGMKRATRWLFVGALTALCEHRPAVAAA